ncbi:NEAT domain-containing protein [Thomasclavelia sp.]|uniref:NEAT domain-containing protein n=1 Tax=Thomasclavelia sp. TaxID=3025757 RepID=UPI0025F560CF|nr:NEAT domain-containing protein [Thomasclavelia sp.]
MKKFFKAALALMMAFSIQVATLHKVKANSVDLTKPGTYEVPIASLESTIPVTTVKQMFSNVFGKSVTVKVGKDNKAEMILNLRHMEVSVLGFKYHANISEIEGATVLQEGEEQYSQSFYPFSGTKTHTVPKRVSLPLSLDGDSQKMVIRVDLLDAFKGEARRVDVKLTLKVGEAIELANYTEIDKAFARVDTLNQDDYTEESWDALQKAMDGVVDNLEAKDQQEVDQMAKKVNDAINALKYKPEKSKLTADGTYNVSVNLWHETQDRPSMANSSLDPVATIIKKDGKATMYITTKPMTFGSITASMQDLYLGSLKSDYKAKPAKIVAKDKAGNPRLWSFTLPHENEYIDIVVNPHVALMGNQDIGARIKVDYGSLQKISDEIIVPKAPEITDDRATEPAVTEDDKATETTVVENDKVTEPAVTENDKAAESTVVEDEKVTEPTVTEKDKTTKPAVVEANGLQKTDTKSNSEVAPVKTSNAVKTGDDAAMELMGGLLISSLALIMYIGKKKIWQ